MSAKSDHEDNKWDANTYRRFHRMQMEVGSEFLAKVSFNSDDRVLIIGCGTGERAAALAKQVKEVVAIDSDPNMLQKARELHPADNITYLAMDAQEMAFDDPFDKIIAIFVMHWIPNKVSVYRRIEECLAPRGEVLLVSSDKSTGIQAATRAVMKQWELGQYVEKQYHFSDETQTCAELKEASLDGCQVSSRFSIFEFRDPIEMFGFFKNLISQRTLVPEAQQDQFISDFVALLIKESGGFGVRFDYIVTHKPPRLVNTAQADTVVADMPTEDANVSVADSNSLRMTL